MDSIVRLQLSRNAETLDGWNQFAPHRERVTQLLLDAVGGEEGELCVLGAGNCNDLALDRLAEAFSHIDLVDIDASAIAAGISRQAVATNRLAARGPIDVTGVADQLSAWTPETPASKRQVDACIAAAERAVLPLNANSYRVAASICLVSQLMESVMLTLGAGHARFLDLITCIRREHLRQLIGLAKPGGTVVLITDVVSSSTLPALTTAASSTLPALVGQAIERRNFFTGVNPFVIRRLLATDPALAARLDDVRLIAPWLWDFGPRLYAVCAITAKRV